MVTFLDAGRGGRGGVGGTAGCQAKDHGDNWESAVANFFTAESFLLNDDVPPVLTLVLVTSDGK